jgi:hypothetical protein
VLRVRKGVLINIHTNEGALVNVHKMRVREGEFGGGGCAN